jgi:serine/threonine-protein kinase RsbW
VIQAPIVHLELESHPDSVGVVRAMLAGASEQLEFGAELLADLKTAVSEACNNVVMHAYGADSGPLIVHLVAGPHTVLVSVRDCGAGSSDWTLPEDHVGLGIAVMNALAAQTEILSSPGAGTEVRLLFAYHRDEMPAVRSAPVPEDLIEDAVHLQGEVMISVSPVNLLGSILGRVAGAVAAQAHFSIDRYSDLYLITDEIAAHAESFASGRGVSVALGTELHQLDLRVGPFRSGSDTRLHVNGDGRRPFLMDLLVDEIKVETIDDVEAVHLLLIDPRGRGHEPGDQPLR